MGLTSPGSCLKEIPQCVVGKQTEASAFCKKTNVDLATACNNRESCKDKTQKLPNWMSEEQSFVGFKHCLGYFIQSHEQWTKGFAWNGLKERTEVLLHFVMRLPDLSILCKRRNSTVSLRENQTPEILTANSFWFCFGPTSKHEQIPNKSLKPTCRVWINFLITSKWKLKTISCVNQSWKALSRAMWLVLPRACWNTYGYFMARGTGSRFD